MWLINQKKVCFLNEVWFSSSLCSVCVMQLHVVWIVEIKTGSSLEVEPELTLNPVSTDTDRNQYLYKVSLRANFFTFSLDYKPNYDTTTTWKNRNETCNADRSMSEAADLIWFNLAFNSNVGNTTKHKNQKSFVTSAISKISCTTQVTLHIQVGVGRNMNLLREMEMIPKTPQAHKINTE